MTKPQRNSASPDELRAALALEAEPVTHILAAAQLERIEGGISEETAIDLMKVGPFDNHAHEADRLAKLADWARDANPSQYAVNLHYSERLADLRAHCPINAARCDADDAYRRAEWQTAAMLYEEAAGATTVLIAREEWLDRARDCHRQAYRDGLTHVDPGPSTREPRNDWERAQSLIDEAGEARADARGWGAVKLAQRALSGLCYMRGADPLLRGSQALCGAMCSPNNSHADGWRRRGAAPDFMAGVSLQVAALCSDRELFDRSWAELDRRCKGEWRKRRREILTPNEAKQMMEER